MMIHMKLIHRAIQETHPACPIPFPRYCRPLLLVIVRLLAFCFVLFLKFKCDVYEESIQMKPIQFATS